MRIFGGDKIAWLMEFLRADEEIPIEHNMVSKSIEGAQKKVEAHHFDTRKSVLQYDDVLSTQREVIYRERRRILEGADLRENMESMLGRAFGHNSWYLYRFQLATRSLARNWLATSIADAFCRYSHASELKAEELARFII